MKALCGHEPKDSCFEDGPDCCLHCSEAKKLTKYRVTGGSMGVILFARTPSEAVLTLYNITYYPRLNFEVKSVNEGPISYVNVFDHVQKSLMKFVVCPVCPLCDEVIEVKDWAFISKQGFVHSSCSEMKRLKEIDAEVA